MNYELALELKNAGFPQKYPWPCGCDGPVSCLDHMVIREPYSPTLSELIEACGDGFAYLSRIEKIPGGITWTCGSWDEEHQCTDKECCEDAIDEATPENAVARLWLALNKK